ncbi:MAG: L-threonylcarbamoyladenylate synthase [Bacteroidota bacterium]|nr:L-threonylcarbamoyladenylate synthase [Bacteroidota bacterium]
MALIGNNIFKAKELLQNGHLVAIPTETVYGLGANALDASAVLKVYEVKQRPFFDPLIIHVSSLDQALNYAELNDERLKKLAQKFWPGPLTLLLPKKNILPSGEAGIPDLVTSGLSNVAVRVPQHELTLQLLNQLNFPVAAPSANPFGYVSPTEAEHVNKQLGEKIEYILDGGKCTVGIESTIVGLEEGEICVYRLGGLAIEDIEKEIGKVSLRINNSSDPKAPGQLKNHYAPNKPLHIGKLNDLIERYNKKTMAILCFGKTPSPKPNVTYFNLSEKENLEEAAINLFSLLRKTGEGNFDVILAEPLPEKGLGRAINDRLRRAETKQSTNWE